jgi:hypothetical protein
MATLNRFVFTGEDKELLTKIFTDPLTRNPTSEHKALVADFLDARNIITRAEHTQTLNSYVDVLLERASVAPMDCPSKEKTHCLFVFIDHFDDKGVYLEALNAFKTGAKDRLYNPRRQPA